MRWRRRNLWLAAAGLILLAGPAAAEDVREAARKAAEARSRETARQREAEQRILGDREALTAEVTRLEAEQARLENRLADLDVHMATQEQLRRELADRWSRSEIQFKEISGNVRLAAKEFETMVHQSPLTAFAPARLEQIRPLTAPGYFPGIDDITGMAALILDEIESSGQVQLRQAAYIGRDGQEAAGQVLNLGTFIAAYRDGDEVGFLNYSPEGRRFVALADLPPRGLRADLRRYIDGQSPAVPVDLSGGGALRQISRNVTFVEQLRAGGPIVWPILGVAFLALVIVLYKIVYLHQTAGNTAKLMGRVNELGSQEKWDDARQAIGNRRSPVAQVLSAGLDVRHEDRETQESVLQEAILHQIPRVERGMAVLAVLGAVAPLLGLLGTVTGMIETFRVITLYGTSDPKLMSGGISEALTTTEIGLAVAIPVMLLHTFLSRRVDHIVGDMEEKAVQLTNIFQKQRRAPLGKVGGG